MSPKDLSPDMITPIIDPAMGKRLQLARMSMDLDQSELAKDLGIAQSTLSKIEQGRSRGTRTCVPLSRWVVALGEHARYVLTGWGAAAYDEMKIRRKYFFTRFNGTQKDPNNKDYVNRRMKRLGIKRLDSEKKTGR